MTYIQRKRPKLGYADKVKRVYPRASVHFDDMEGTYEVLANNGTGNTLSSSKVGETDAWKRACAMIESQQRAFR